MDLSDFQFNTTNSIELSGNISKNLVDQGNDLSAGGLMELSNLQLRLLQKRTDEREPEQDKHNFTMNFLTSVDILLGPLASWTTLNGSFDAFNATNNLLTSIPQCGQQYLRNQSSDRVVVGGETFKFEGNNTLSRFQTIPPPTDDGYVFGSATAPFDTVSIFVPANVLKAQQLSAIDIVGTSFYIDNKEAKRFPTFYFDGSTNQTLERASLTPAMIDVTMLDFSVKNLTDEDRIQITFQVENTLDVSIRFILEMHPCSLSSLSCSSFPHV